MYKLLTATKLVILAIAMVTLLMPITGVEAQSANPQSGSAGLTGTVPSDPPSTGATISFPGNNQTFTDVPIEVTGLCTPDLIVKIFKNEVFSGAVVCESNGTYSITVDLFSGTNILVARIFDALDQPGPDSNIVTVEYDDGNGVPGAIDRVTITTNFAKRGANPGNTLTWPFIITGGTGPYAINIDWGDGTNELYSQPSPGDFEASHVYEQPGTYKVTANITDSIGSKTFLQIIGVANGPILSRVDTIDSESGNFSEVRTRTVTNLIVWPLYLMLFMILTTFWLGRRYEFKRFKKRIQAGDNFR